jgi:transcriptional regulator with XRE-family HTH domain
MTDDPLTDLLGEVRRIADPIERAKRYTELIERFGSATALASEGRHEALIEARDVKGIAQADIAKALGLTPARINQMLKSKLGPPPERALLALDAGVPVSIAVVEKRDAEGGKPTVLLSTQHAVDKLQELASTLSLQTEKQPEVIPPPGIVDLNRNNLVVLIGPRISALVAQVVASDPVIHWRRNKRNHWYLVDSKTGAEFHSDFDNGGAPADDGERECIAHIGRVRRPDSQGSFLYLGGAHAAGTAGAVDVFVREYTSIWEQAKRAVWSAIVVTKTDRDGEIISADLATPIYVHGKR